MSLKWADQLFLIMTQQHSCVTCLEEAGDSGSPTFVPVHPSHETTSFDVSSASVVGDALENTTSEPPIIILSRHKRKWYIFDQNSTKQKSKIN